MAHLGTSEPRNLESRKASVTPMRWLASVAAALVAGSVGVSRGAGWSAFGCPLVVASCMAGCERHAEDIDSESAAPIQDACNIKGMPVSSVPSIDLGVVPQGEQRLVEIPLVNDGLYDRRIAAAETTCGCAMLLSSDALVPAGGTLVVHARVRASQEGELNASVLFMLDDGASVRVPIIATVVSSAPPLRVPRRLALDDEGGFSVTVMALAEVEPSILVARVIGLSDSASIAVDGWRELGVAPAESSSVAADSEPSADRPVSTWAARVTGSVAMAHPFATLLIEADGFKPGIIVLEPSPRRARSVVREVSARESVGEPSRSSIASVFMETITSRAVEFVLALPSAAALAALPGAAPNVPVSGRPPPPHPGTDPTVPHPPPAIEGVVPGPVWRRLADSIVAAAGPLDRPSVHGLVWESIGVYEREVREVTQSLIAAEREAGWYRVWVDGEKRRWVTDGVTNLMWIVSDRDARRVAAMMRGAYASAYERLDRVEEHVLSELGAWHAAVHDDGERPERWRALAAEARRAGWLDQPRTYTLGVVPDRDLSVVLERFLSSLHAEDEGGGKLGPRRRDLIAVAIAEHEARVDGVIHDVHRSTRVEIAVSRYLLSGGTEEAREAWARLDTRRFAPLVDLTIETAARVAAICAAADAEHSLGLESRWNRKWRAALAPMVIREHDVAERVGSLVRDGVSDERRDEVDLVLIQHGSRRDSIERRLLAAAIAWRRDALPALGFPLPPQAIVAMELELQDLERESIARLLELMPGGYRRRLAESVAATVGADDPTRPRHWTGFAPGTAPRSAGGETD